MKQPTEWFKEIMEASDMMCQECAERSPHRFKWLVQTNDDRTETYKQFFNNHIHGKKENTPDKTTERQEQEINKEIVSLVP